MSPTLSNPAELLTQLKTQGVSLILEGERVKVVPASKLTPDLLAILKAHKDLLKAHLKEQSTALPWQLKGLIRAAYAGTLPTETTRLPSGGLVSDLGGYVLQACALYLLGNSEQATKELWAAHSAWQGAHHA